MIEWLRQLSFLLLIASYENPNGLVFVRLEFSCGNCNHFYKFHQES